MQLPHSQCPYFLQIDQKLQVSHPNLGSTSKGLSCLIHSKLGILMNMQAASTYTLNGLQ